ncbi:phage protein Gp36 family protein [Reichenbachiella sp.]|uniref:phage protein Gp36 family protein n=1 Tax=Reichenbachiella sp. TaxID=2184521 RepID=UPI003B5AB380
MSTFITRTDYKSKIHSDHLGDILDDEDFTADDILDEAEEHAIAIIKDALKGTYDLDTIFDAADDARPKNVVRWATTIVLYILYERIPDDLVPDRIVKNYNDTMDLLDDISDGKRKVDLPVLEDENGDIATKFRWGSQEARSH